MTRPLVLNKEQKARQTERIMNMVKVNALRGDILQSVPCKKADLDKFLEDHPKINYQGRKPNCLTEWQLKTLEKCCLAKMKTAEVARQAKCDVSTVREHAMKNPKLKAYWNQMRHRLTWENRVAIEKGKKRKKTNIQIAKELNVNKETVSNEIRKYKSADGIYKAKAAHQAYRKSAKESREKRDQTMRSMLRF